MEKKLLNPWEMTKKEYTDFIDKFSNNPYRFNNEQYLFIFKNHLLTGLINHEEWIKEALIKEYYVPEKVLKDYPHLKNIEKPLVIIWCNYKEFPSNVEVGIWIDKKLKTQPAFISIIREFLEKAYEKLPDIIFARIHIYPKEDVLHFYPFEVDYPQKFKPKMITPKKAATVLIPQLKNIEKEAIKEIEKKIGVNPYKTFKEMLEEN